VRFLERKPHGDQFLREDVERLKAKVGGGDARHEER
jgi:hypothetical protein